jgi:hypothetical protein
MFELGSIRIRTNVAFILSIQVGEVGEYTRVISVLLICRRLVLKTS